MFSLITSNLCLLRWNIFSCTVCCYSLLSLLDKTNCICNRSQPSKTRRRRKMADEQKQKLVAGLESSPKYIPVSYKYDEIGSRLQKESCEHNHDYYITASELSILQHNVQDIIPDVPNDLTLVDLGSGDCSKTRFVIKELLKRQKTLMYYPLDISGEFLIKAAKSLKDDFGDLLEVHPIASDFIQGMEQLKRIKGVKLVLWIGGIFALPYEDQISKLKLFSTIMTDQCRLVFTADITQNRMDILKAYNDNTGISVLDVNIKIIRNIALNN
ncbi:histidine N-alpha-methyltransferase-like isoform X1 [Argopecten irradians]|uniref:histidine N-alpha-methyltransferase-like isoform X1 n=2 Tax=Argopecten irradians TaxID=31199 RepID=UPI00371F9F5C